MYIKALHVYSHTHMRTRARTHISTRKIQYINEIISYLHWLCYEEWLYLMSGVSCWARTAYAINLLITFLPTFGD